MTHQSNERSGYPQETMLSPFEQDLQELRNILDASFKVIRDDRLLLDDESADVLASKFVIPTVNHLLEQASDDDRSDARYRHSVVHRVKQVSDGARAAELLSRSISDVFRPRPLLYGIRSSMKLADLSEGLTPKDRSRLGTVLTEEAVAIIDRHTHAAHPGAHHIDTDKVDRFLDLADKVAPAETVNPAQVQTRQAARLVNNVARGRSVARIEVNDLARQAQRLASVPNNSSNALLPEEDIALQKSLNEALARFPSTGNRHDDATIRRISEGLVDFNDRQLSTVDLPGVPSATVAQSVVKPGKRGSATDISVPTARTAIVEVVSKGDRRDAYSIWTPSRSAVAKAGAAVAITAGIVSTVSPAAAAVSSNARSERLPTIRIASPNKTTANLAITPPKAAAAQQTTQPETLQIIEPLNISASELPAVAAQNKTKLSKLGTFLGRNATARSTMTPDTAIVPIATSSVLPAIEQLQMPAEAAPSIATLAASGHTEGPQVVLPALTTLSTVHSADALVTPLPPVIRTETPVATTTTSKQGDIVLTNKETAVSATANQPTLSTITTLTTDATQQYVRIENTPVAAPQSTQETLANDLASGADIDVIAKDTLAVLQNQATANGNKLTASSNLAQFRAATLQAAREINPTSSDAMRRAAVAIVLSDHPELLADANATAQIQAAFDTKNTIFDNAFMKWLNNQASAPANVIGNQDFDTTDLVVATTKLLTAAKAFGMSDAQVQAWLNVHDLPAAIQFRTQKAAQLAVTKTIDHRTGAQSVTISKPKAPAHAAPAVHPSATRANKQPAKANIATNVSEYELNSQQNRIIDGLNITNDQKAFLKRLIPAVMQGVDKGYRINPYAVIGQGMLETGGGTSSIARQANNLFGTKAGSGWSGATMTANGSEQNADGSYTPYSIVWRKYPTLTAAIDDYALEIGNLSWYHDAMACDQDPSDYLKALENHLNETNCEVIGSEPSWATSHQYVPNVLNVISNDRISAILSAGRKFSVSRLGVGQPKPAVKPVTQSHIVTTSLVTPEAKAKTPQQNLVATALKYAKLSTDFNDHQPNAAYLAARRARYPGGVNSPWNEADTDCSMFIKLAVNNSGIDPNWTGNSGAALAYARNSPLWKVYDDPTTAPGGQQPGDIMAKSGHISMFVGLQSNGKSMAEASWDEGSGGHVPEVDSRPYEKGFALIRYVG